MVKWTTLDPCSGLSESDPKLYTNFEYHKIEYKTYEFTKPSNLCSNFFFKQRTVGY